MGCLCNGRCGGPFRIAAAIPASLMPVGRACNSGLVPVFFLFRRATQDIQPHLRINGLIFPTMRPSRLIFALFLLLFAGLPVLALTNSAEGPHVHVQLVFPGGNFLPVGHDPAGVYFQLEPGWHIYWRNPGDAGEPPHIHWTLPEGVAAGPMQFPAPKRLPLGPLMDFGYEDHVLFRNGA